LKKLCLEGDEMKNISIAILMMGILTVFSLGLDILQGFDKNTAIRNALSPFRVMEKPEIFSFSFLILLLIINPIVNSYKKRKDKISPKSS
jgi:hypothetical protein